MPKIFPGLCRCYKANFISICQEAGADPAAIRKRMEDNISAILDEYPNKLAYSSTLVDAVKASGYELSDESRKHLYDVHEEEDYGKISYAIRTFRNAKDI